MNHTAAGPRDHLILDIGGDIGALAIYAPAATAGQETEISPVGDPAHRTHNVIRPRRIGPATQYAAVFPSLAAGSYVVWANDTTPAGTVTIRGGHVAQFLLAATAGHQPTESFSAQNPNIAARSANGTPCRRGDS